MTEKLKPCPFCGSEDIEIRKGVVFAGAVYCRTCTADVIFNAVDNLYNELSWEENLISKWNKRSEADD